MEQVALEDIRPVDNPAVAPDIVELPGAAGLADIAGPTEIVDDPDLDPIAAMNDQAVAPSNRRMVPLPRMVYHPAQPGHHQNMPRLQDLPAD